MLRECSTHGGEEDFIQDFGWNAISKRPLGRSRRRWEDNIKMDLRERERGCGGQDWIDLA
jgi:hypothetical protein